MTLIVPVDPDEVDKNIAVLDTASDQTLPARMAGHLSARERHW